MFGEAVRIQENANRAAAQVAGFMGVEGVMSSYAGTRGRVFLCEGLFTGLTIADCVAYTLAWRSYIGAPGMTLVDTFERAWYPVIFLGELECTGGPKPARTAASGECYAWPYKLVLQGLS